MEIFKLYYVCKPWLQILSQRSFITEDLETCGKARSTPATMSKQCSTLLPKTATMSNELIVKFRPFDKVECCFDKVRRCFDIFAGVNRALTEYTNTIDICT